MSNVSEGMIDYVGSSLFVCWGLVDKHGKVWGDDMRDLVRKTLEGALKMSEITPADFAVQEGR